MNQFVFVFPGGKKKIQKATTVAGNVLTTITVPTGKIWLLLNVMIELTTDANAGNRYPYVITQDVANIKKYQVASNVITASTTATKYWSQMVSRTDQNMNALGLQLLEAAEDVVLAITNGLAGDAYDYLLEYLEIDMP